jgi:hypothetical protein
VDGPGTCWKRVSMRFFWQCAEVRSRQGYKPFALTHSELRLGRAAWSLMCSSDSGGSVYIRLLDRLLRAALVSMLEAALSECLLWFGGRFVSPAKLRPEVGCSSVEDSLAVFAGAADAEGSGIVAVVDALLHRGIDTGVIEATKKAKKTWEQRQASKMIEQESWVTGRK